MVIGMPGLLQMNFLKRYVCLIVLCFLGNLPFGQDCSAESKTRATAMFLDGNGRELCRFEVELAVTPEEQLQGLMFRKDLPSGSGMLFLNNSDDMRSFWMKNTYIPLDMIFINSQREVKHVHYSAKPLNEKPISSRYPVRYILEINAGRAKKCNIIPGTKMQFLF